MSEESKVNWYQKLKYENEELKRKLSEVNTLTVQMDNSPSFLFTDKATNHGTPVLICHNDLNFWCRMIRDHAEHQIHSHGVVLC